jgi:hypothetical protein
LCVGWTCRGRSAVQMAVRLQPCPLSRGPGWVNALSAGRSIQCCVRDAAQEQSGGYTIGAEAMVMGMDVPVRVRGGGE